MSELAGDGVPVTVFLPVLKLSYQPYYRWLKQQVAQAELTQAELTQAYRVNAFRVKALLDAHRDDPEYGDWFLVNEAARAGGGKFYLCVIKDVCSGRIVGYSMSSRMKARLGRGRLGGRGNTAW